MADPLLTWPAFYSKFAKENRGSTRKQASIAWAEYKEENEIVPKSTKTKSIKTQTKPLRYQDITKPITRKPKKGKERVEEEEITPIQQTDNQKVVYVLAVLNDAPYHGETEYWMRGKVSELIEIAKENWSWMKERAVWIDRAVIGQKCMRQIIGFDELGKLIRKKKPDTTQYPDGEEISGHYFLCNKCKIVYNTPLEEKLLCKECQRECENMEG